MIVDYLVKAPLKVSRKMHAAGDRISLDRDKELERLGYLELIGKQSTQEKPKKKKGEKP